MSNRSLVGRAGTLKTPARYAGAIAAGVGAIVLATLPATVEARSSLGRDSPAPASSRSLGPHECRPGERPADATAVVRLVRAVVAAFNAGNATAIDRLVAPEPAFKWFSAIGPDHRLGRKAEDRSTLGAYIRKRHRHHDRLTLVNFGTRNDQGRLNLRLVFRRLADDYRPQSLIPGKASGLCRAGTAKLIVWSM